MKTIYDALTRAHYAKRGNRRRRFRRFRLRTLMALMTAAAPLFALLALRGRSLVQSVATRWQSAVSRVAQEPADGIIFFLNAIVGLLLGSVVFFIVYRADEKWGFRLLYGLCSVALIMFVAGVSLDTSSVSKTALRDLRFAQVARIELLWLACVVPVSSFLGWYCASIKRQHG